MRDNEGFYFTKIIKSISRGEKPEIINLYCANDYIHASDIARAIISLVENQAEEYLTSAQENSFLQKYYLIWFMKSLEIKVKSKTILVII